MANNRILRCRLGTLDPVKIGLEYHVSCYNRERLLAQSQQQEADDAVMPKDHEFTALFKTLDVGLQQGNVYSLKEIANSCRDVAVSNCNNRFGESRSTYTNWRLRDRLVEHYGDQITFVKPTKKNESTLILSRHGVDSAVNAMNVKITDDFTASFENSSAPIGESFSEIGHLFHAGSIIARDLKDSKEMEDLNDISLDRAKHRPGKLVHVFVISFMRRK